MIGAEDYMNAALDAHIFEAGLTRLTELVRAMNTNRPHGLVDHDIVTTAAEAGLLTPVERAASIIRRRWDGHVVRWRDREEMVAVANTIRGLGKYGAEDMAALSGVAEAALVESIPAAWRRPQRRTPMAVRVDPAVRTGTESKPDTLGDAIATVLAHRRPVPGAPFDWAAPAVKRAKAVLAQHLRGDKSMDGLRRIAGLCGISAADMFGVFSA